MDRQVFLARLNHSIEQLEQQLAAVEGNLTARMQYWQHTRARTRALEKVVQRYQTQEQSRQNRLQQKEQDEMAGRKGNGS